MTNKEKVEFLKEICTDLEKNACNVCNYHNVDENKVYAATEKLHQFMEGVIEFYMLDDDSKTSKKACLFNIINNLNSNSFDISFCGQDFDSPIEELLYHSLIITMPSELKTKIIIKTQYYICDEKYRVDIMIMKLKIEGDYDSEWIPLVAVECDGYKYHNSTPEVVTSSYERIREIKMTEDIEVFQYSGTEIYNNCVEIAKELWEYIKGKLDT